MTAIWTTPHGWSAGELDTKSLMDTFWRDNLDWLKTPPAASAVGTSDISTTSTSLVDMTNMSGTITMVGSRAVCGFLAPFYSDAVRILTMAVYIDGVQGGLTAYRADIDTVPKHISWLARFTSIAAGSRIFTARWATSAGTMNQNGGSHINRRFFCAEGT